MLTNFTTRWISIAMLLTQLAISTTAQNPTANYSQVYSANLKGGTAVLGNTSMNIYSNFSNSIRTDKMNDIANAGNGVGGIGNTQYGNDDENMQFADIDGVTATFNSSSADLILPAGSNNIKFARLYWGGRISSAAITSVPDTLRKVKIRKGTGSYNNVLAATTSVDMFPIAGTSETVYQAYSDITAYVHSNGAGTFTVADIPATPGSTSSGGRFAGWSIVVAYENSASLLNSVRIYHGFFEMFTATSGPASVSVTLNNLNVPNNSLAASDAVMSVMGWEGDGNLGASGTNPAGDFVKVNNVVVSNTTNLGTNFWNGSITNNGAYVTTKNPSYANQMGIDIDQVNVGTGYGILPNATSVTLTFGTEADQYFPSYFAFALRVKDPLVTISKTVTDANNNYAIESNEVLTYTLTGTNIGPGQANNVYVVDSLPGNVTYVANSMEVVSCVGATVGMQTDAIDGADKSFKSINAGREYVKFFLGSGATNATGGSMNVGQTYTVKFKVKAAVIPGSVTNTATSYAYSVGGDLFTDISTAIMAPVGAPLSVKMVSFNAALNNKNALLNWVTESEINNDYFDVERSEDGINFTKIATVKGSGTSASMHHYDLTDNLSGTAAAIVYYRLKVVDISARASYSKIVLVRLNGAFSAAAISVYPNPFVSDVKIFIRSTKTTTAMFKLLAADGKEVYAKKAVVETGNNIIVLNDIQTLPKGNYMLEIVSATDKITTMILKN